MNRLDPELLFDLLEAHLPAQVREHVLVVGSLAAAMTHREQLRERGVNTKDCDVVIQPAGALPEATLLATTLLEAGWRPLAKCKPGVKSDPVSQLSVVRLNPPTSDAYFIELLGLPGPTQSDAKVMIPFEAKGAWYALPSFRFMSVLTFERQTRNSIAYASASMMALANLLAHREIGTARVSEPMAGRNPLRAAKDLGRVLALARLEVREVTEAWPERWLVALQTCFPAEWRQLAMQSGDGLRALLRDAAALDDALHTVTIGLLDGKNVNVDQLRAIGEQVLADVIEPLQRLTSDSTQPKERP
ncbi:MAG: hypothetical protein Q8N26_28915 [Myxococcales bacterium]|nr:hypothetical protein [Myxococcales bacterium]